MTKVFNKQHAYYFIRCHECQMAEKLLTISMS